nr:BCCT family transporter [Ornithinicoccus halotolerans]
MFIPAMGVLAIAVAIAILAPSATEQALNTIQTEIVGGFGWYYVLIVAGFVIFSLFLGLSRFGNITLGKDEEEPEFSLMAWFAMLFAAGMGIGLVFWGAAEPLTFFASDPKPGVSTIGVNEAGEPILAGQAQMARAAMAQTFLHWGFHAWAIYVVVGLAVAYSVHRKGRPVSIRWALEPILGDRVKGWIGDVIDVVAVVGTVAGVATSLGLGVQQISAGLVHIGLFDSVTDGLLVGLISVITLIAVGSVLSGVGRGIKWLSNTNLVLAGIFLVAVLLLGPTLFLLRDFVQSIGGYFQNVVQLTFDTSAYTTEEGQVWQGFWTTFYWGWWMSWAPFVGIFIARVSRGRTVREFVAGVLLVPTLVTFVWFSVMGGAAIHREMFGGGGLLGEDNSVVSEQVLFDLLNGLPLGSVLSVIAIILVAIFFITSSDSGSLVVDMLASGGETDPPKWSRAMWAVLEGLVAIALLLAGGLTALRTGAIITALPFSFVMIAMCVATYKAMHEEHLVLLRAERRQRREQLQHEVGAQVRGDLTENFDQHFGEQVDDRIETALSNGSDSRAGGPDEPTPRRSRFSPRR